jgi:chromosome segregation ATPase
MVANGTGEYILVPKRILQALKAQLQRTTDALTLAETELQLVREECGAREGLAEKLTETEAELELVRAERDDLARRAQAAKAIWDPVTQPRSTSVDP